MNVAIVTSEFITESNFDGGLANYNYKLAKSLQLAGHDPVVIVSSTVNDEIRFDDIEVHRVDVMGYDRSLFRSKLFCKSYSRFKRFLKAKTSVIMWYELMHQTKCLNMKLDDIREKREMDIVHYSSLGGVGLKRPRNIPAIARLSGSSSISQDFGGYGESDRVINAQERIEFRALKKMDGVFGPSRMVADIVGKSIGRKISIIETPYYFPGEPLDENFYTINLKGKKYALFFGSIGLIKGCGTIAGIIGEFLHMHPDYYFVFIGKIQHSPVQGLNMFQFLKQKAGQYADRVLHFDKLPHTLLFPIIIHAEFAVLPSRIDNFPNTCIEAMGLGKIVIGTKGNGFEQMIEDGISGFLIRVDDHEQLLGVLEKVIAMSPAERTFMENKAKQRMSLLQPGIIAAQLVSFYKEIIEKFKLKNS